MAHSLTVKQVAGKPGQVYYPLQLNEIARPTPGPGELLVRMRAVALNHRDLFIRQHLYPGISFEHPLLADGYGIVEEVGPGCRRRDVAIVGTGVVLAPIRHWDSDPDGPEDEARFTALGAAVGTPAGTAIDYLCVPEDDLEAAPPHLTAAEAAALPLVGLTAWRALVTKSGIDRPTGHHRHGQGPRNVLVTGIGGGVAMVAAQLAIAHDCRVFVTSGDVAKLARARDELGASGGVSYRDADWDRQLLSQLPTTAPLFDVVVDGAGGDIVRRASRLLRPGGIIASYGMTVGPRLDWTMQAVLHNIDLKGCTMGSRAEFRALVAFVRQHHIRPVVSRVVHGGLSLANLPAIDGLFDDMKAGRQFGKLVLQFDEPADGLADGQADQADSPSKL
ncbi:alcohol dehydrogenase [Grosmannia clavigera kw1407]|uniref:Alcohol dehydrogenase n=1 Tax=Grosmannia clavigera (strain kw1407 / UAMH 11150) TaxID=655863 RepID=F0XFM3_GROCL|nr:alcohol dehydrogenase [Grosmannia clavigera kw1407]EFX04769.1 alcohol dehydrogenase [Grosmannia clavigera kw1407]